MSGNREKFLTALRSGDYPKGTIRTDGQGRPLISGPSDEGFCAVGLMDTLFNPSFTSQGRRTAMGLKQADITMIQQEWNDSPLTFPQIADLIENRLFSK